MNKVNTKILKINKTPWHSWCTGKIAKGCAYCVQGRKLVLFVTGICPRKCYFCPVSDQKYGKDVIYANERVISADSANKDILEEADSMQAKGAGITGGDPLMKLDRTISYIKLLKEKFGARFHIHLYTSLDLVTEESLKKLFEAGLDEIRFHPDLKNKSNWDKISIANKFKTKPCLNAGIACSNTTNQNGYKKLGP